MKKPYFVGVFRESEMTLRGKLLEIKYWYVTRHARKFVPWLATKLPKNLKYYVVIHGMCKVEPNFSPEGVTGMQMLDLWKEKAEA